MISCSRPGLSPSGASNRRRSSPHSGMVDSGDEAHRRDERAPRIALACKHAAPLGGQTVETAPALSRFLDPPPLQPASFFETIEQRIERRDVEFQLPGRSRLDEPADLITVPRAAFDNGQ